MSLINEYRATEEAIKELQARLKNLSQDDKLQTELEFEGKLRTLMGEYSKSLRDIIALLDPESKVKAPRGAVKTTGTKRARKVKQYKNPHNGEVIETKTNRSRVIAVWFTPDLYAMKGPATKYSTLLSAKIGRTTWDDSGNGYKIKKDVSKKSHGYDEVLSCYK